MMIYSRKVFLLVIFLFPIQRVGVFFLWDFRCSFASNKMGKQRERNKSLKEKKVGVFWVSVYKSKEEGKEYKGKMDFSVIATWVAIPNNNNIL